MEFRGNWAGGRLGLICVCVFIAVVAGMILLLAAPPVEGATIYVPGDQPTIQAAVDAAGPGDTVEVAAGTYYENVVVNNSLTLLGAGAADTIVDGQGLDYPINVAGSWVNVSGFTFFNSSFLDGAAYVGYANDCGFTNNTFMVDNYGLRISDSSNIYVGYNKMNETFNDGLLIGDSDNVTVEFNDFMDNNNVGILLGSCERVLVHNNWFNNGGGRWLQISNVALSTFQNNTVGSTALTTGVSIYRQSNCTYKNNTMDHEGFHLSGSYLYEMASLDLDTTNTVAGKPVYYFANQVGGVVPAGGAQIILANCTGMNVSGHSGFETITAIKLAYSDGNTIWGNTLVGSVIDLYRSNYNLIHGNQITDGYRAITMSWSDNNTVSENWLENNTDGSYLHYSNNNTFYHNNYIDNDEQVSHDSGIIYNKWNLTYPGGGNYWSHHTTPDTKSGPNQDQAGADGFVDIPLVIAFSTDQDFYPFTTSDGWPLPNQPPVPDAGPDQDVQLGDVVFFDGSGSYDPDGPIVSSSWDFDLSDEGFVKQGETNNSDVHWNATAGNIYFKSDRYDLYDERMVHALPQPFTDKAVDWELSADFMINQAGWWTHAYPIYIGNSENDDLRWGSNQLNIVWERSDAEGPTYNRIMAWYRGANGQMEAFMMYDSGLLDTQYSVNISYAAFAKTLSVELYEVGALVDSGTYAIGTNANDHFTFDEIGVAANGLINKVVNVTPEPPVIGWTDNIQFDYQGSLTYEWDFGDGTNASGVMVNHAYVNLSTDAVPVELHDGQNWLNVPQSAVDGGWTSWTLAEEIEANTDFLVLYISKWNFAWVTYLRRDGTEPYAYLSAFNGTAFLLDTNETYWVQLASVGTPLNTTYQTTGYVVTLNVTDDQGASISDACIVTVTSIPGYGPVHNLDNGTYHATIQEAIDNASDGHTIEVSAGTYYENVVVDKRLTLRGEDRNTTVIDGGGNGSVVRVASWFANITSFTITGSGGGEYEAGVHVPSSYKCSIEDCVIVNNSHGVLLSATQDIKIVGNEITDNVNGTCLWGPFSSNTEIKYNVISNNSNMGIGLFESNLNDIHDNTISGNWNGISAYSSATSNWIHNNTITSQSHDGMSLHNVSNAFLTNNTISSNDWDGIYLGSDSQWNSVVDNIISSNQNYGIYLDSNDNVLYHNVIADNANQSRDGGLNTWNLSLPDGGNYWSDWTTPDTQSGPNQDQPGSDGIVDNPRAIGGGANQDYYPFTTPSGWLNGKPSILTFDQTTATEDQLYSVDYEAIDPENDTLTWALDTNATWLSIDAVFGVLSGTPVQADVGFYTVIVYVTDDKGGVDSHYFTLTVQNVDDPPVITTGDTVDAWEDQTYYVDYDAYDEDGDQLAWNVTGPAWLSIDPVTGELNGTPTQSDVGVYLVNVSVSAGGAVDSHAFNLTVHAVNDAPIITTHDVVDVIEDELYLVDYEAYDEEDDPLYWNFSTNASWLTFNYTSALVYGTPSSSDVGVYWIDISVNDGNGGLDQRLFDLTVTNVNDPPVITTQAVPDATEDVEYSVNYNATDADGDPVVWSLNTSASWLTIDPVTGVLSGIPANDDVGAYGVSISAYDGNGGWDWQNYTLTVQNVNDPPTIMTPDVVNATEDQPYMLDYEAYDEDGDSLTWTLWTNATWLSFNDTSGLLYGTPADSDVGTFWVNISDKHFFDLTVWNVNDPPVITTQYADAAIEDVEYYVDYEATDADGDALTWVLYSSASWLTIDPVTGELNGTPANDDVGAYGVSVGAYDGNGGWGWQNFTLYVINVNDPPEIIEPIPIPSIYEGTDFSIDFDALDPDGDALTWTIIDNASWPVSLHAETGVLSGSPPMHSVGPYWLNVSVDDGNGGSDLVNVTINVLNVPEGPVITTADVTTATEDELYSVDYDAFDGDGDTLSWTLDTDAGWLSIDPATGILSGLPANDDVGTYSVNVTVHDGTGLMDSALFALTVQNVNDPPVITTSEVLPAVEDEFYISAYEADDVDGGPLAWSVATNASWLSMLSSSGTLIGMPGGDDVGTYWVNVTVDDGYGGMDWLNFTLLVENVNDPPVITTSDQTIAYEDASYSVDYDAYDDDGDDLTWSMTSDAGWLSIDPATGEVSGLPANGDVGTYNVTIRVSDGNGGEDVSSFTLTVLGRNDPPIPGANYYTGIYAYDGEELNVTVVASGEKYQRIDVLLIETRPGQSPTTISNQSMNRTPGDPKEKAVNMVLELDTDNEYSLAIRYFSHEQGATPVKTTLVWGTNTVQAHYTFNAQHGEADEITYDLMTILGSAESSPRTVRVDASPSWDPDDAIAQYHWDFGDGNESSGMEAIHECGAIGLYTVCLTVTDASGAQSSVSFTVDLALMAHVGTVQTYATQYTYVEYVVGGNEGEVVATRVEDPSGVLDTRGTGRCYDYTVTGGSLEWANITLYYYEGELPPGVTEEDLRLYWWNDATNEWVLVPDSGVNTEANYVWGNTTHFTVYAAIAKSVTPTTVSAPVSSPFPWLSLFVMFFAAMCVGIVASSLIIGVEWIFLAFIGPLAAVAARKGVREDKELRGLLKGMIMARPGVHYRWLKLTSGRSNGTVAYHLRKMEDQGDIRAKHDGMLKRYYPTRNIKITDVELPKVPMAESILEVLREHPGASISEVAYLIDESRQKIHYHIRKLQQEGIIIVKKDEQGHTECFIKKKENGGKLSGVDASGTRRKKKTRKRTQARPEVEIVVLNKVEPQMYECPSCGGDLAEGTNPCPGCGDEMDWD